MRDTLHTGSSVVVVSSNRTLLFRALAALLAGMIALAANMALLSIASASGIRTAHGGLFLLFTKIIHRVAPSSSRRLRRLPLCWAQTSPEAIVWR